MPSSPSLRSALLALAAASIAACPGEDGTAPAPDPPCAEPSAPVSVDAAPPAPLPAASSVRVERRAPPTDARRTDARAPTFVVGRVEVGDLEALGFELAPSATPDEVVVQLQPFVERLATVAAARCELGARPACARLLTLFALGAIVPGDLDAVDRFRDDHLDAWRAACHEGDDDACVSLLDLPPEVGVDARPALGRALCARHHGLGCEVLASAADAADTRATLRVTAAGLYVDACDDGDVRACERLAAMYRRDEVANALRPRARRTGLLEHARALWRARCDAGDPFACGELGVAWLTGPKPSPRTAREAFARAVPPVRLPAP